MIFEVIIKDAIHTWLRYFVVLNASTLIRWIIKVIDFMIIRIIIDKFPCKVILNFNPNVILHGLTPTTLTVVTGRSQVKIFWCITELILLYRCMKNILCGRKVTTGKNSSFQNIYWWIRTFVLLEKVCTMPIVRRPGRIVELQWLCDEHRGGSCHRFESSFMHLYEDVWFVVLSRTDYR